MTPQTKIELEHQVYHGRKAKRLRIAEGLRPIENRPAGCNPAPRRLCYIYNMTLFLQHSLLVLSCAAAFGQPAFEAASVKPAPARSGAAARPRMQGGPDSGDPVQITYTNATLMSVLLRAYD